MNNLKDFAAIDFEIANLNRSSVCSVGVALVRGGEIVDTLYRLINPRPEYYFWRFTRIHKLTERDTMNAPLFPEVWAEIAPKISGLPLVAHNAAFDKSCLRAAHEFFGMEYPQYEFHCTCLGAREYFKTLPENLRPEDASIDSASKFFNVRLENHHNAIADALACAQIALAM
ncbi:MAG: 3'-5' exonuclease [Opitutales bacterium]|nr:3'-5' exonuclease [Opitutales bacterium]